MSEEKVQIMVEGGKASASPQMAQSLGPKGINIKDVLSQTPPADALRLRGPA